MKKLQIIDSAYLVLEEDTITSVTHCRTKERFDVLERTQEEGVYREILSPKRDNISRSSMTTQGKYRSKVELNFDIENYSIPSTFDYFFPVKFSSNPNTILCKENLYSHYYFGTSLQSYQDRVIGILKKGKETVSYFGFRKFENNWRCYREILFNESFF